MSDAYVSGPSDDAAGSAAMALSDRVLRRLLRKPTVAELLNKQIESLGPDHVITAMDGTVLAGDGSRIKGAAQAIACDGNTLGQVYGHHSMLLAKLVNTLVAQDVEARALARESLDRYKEVTMLYDLSENIIGSPDVQSVVTLIGEEAEQYLGCDSVAVLLLNEETKRLEISATRGIPFHSRASLNVRNDILAAVLSSGVGEIVNELSADSRSLEADNALRSIVCSPVKSKRKILGLLIAGNASPRHFNAGDLQILNAMAAQAGTAIEATRLDQELNVTSRKPADLIYGVDERPPFGVSLVLGLQHVFIALMSLAYPVLITLEAGGSRSDASAVVSMSLIAMAIATVLQASRFGPVGSGFLTPNITSAIYLAPSLFAARVGGLGLVFGMTILSGIFGLALSQILRKFRKLFPPEVSGVIVLMVGLSIVPVGFQRFLSLNSAGMITQPMGWIVGIMTLGAIIAFTVAPLGRLRLYSTIIGIMVGYLTAIFLGIINEKTFGPVLDLPVFGLPKFPQHGLELDLVLVLPFLAAALAAGVKDAGMITGAQKINDAYWKRPDTRSVSGGIVASSIGNIASGLMGGVGLSISAGSIGLAAATGATSRVIALFASGILIGLAFMPKVTAAVALMPSSVMGAGLLYVACHLVTSGAELITSRMLDMRRTYVIGLSLLAGVGVMVMPDVMTAGPDWARALFGSPLAISTFLAMGLNLALSLWVSSRAEARIEIDGQLNDSITRFFERQGAAWGARSDVIRRAAPAITEWCEELRQFSSASAVNIGLRFDEFRLTAAVAASDTKSANIAANPTVEPQSLLQIVKRIARRYQCSGRLTGSWDATFEFEH